MRGNHPLLRLSRSDGRTTVLRGHGRTLELRWVELGAGRARIMHSVAAPPRASSRQERDLHIVYSTVREMQQDEHQETQFLFQQQQQQRGHGSGGGVAQGLPFCDPTPCHPDNSRCQLQKVSRALGVKLDEGGDSDCELAMNFVGSGRGDWLAQKTYKFVGNGEGTHNLDSLPAPASNRFRCYGLIAAASFCAALAFLCAVASMTSVTSKAAEREGTSAGSAVLATTTTLPDRTGYLASSAVGAAPAGSVAGSWTAAKSFLPSSAPSTVAPAIPVATAVAGSGAWTPAAGVVGGAVAAPVNPELQPNVAAAGITSRSFNCTPSLGTSWKREWSVKKKEWCCQYTGRGCSPLLGAR